MIVTNYHCVQGALQYNSTPEDNLSENGFLAATKADEKSNGPAARVYVNQRFTDVTERIRADLSSIADPRTRYDLMETRSKELIAECERERPGVRCAVRRYFRGALFYMIESLEIRDVRLVYAPNRGIGLFGGDEDNWMWPRHSGDYAFYRAYVGKDGQPADYSPDNVPYQPKHHLAVASKPLRPGEFVMVAGFPGKTQRHRTATEVAEAVEWSFPRRMAMLEEYVAILHTLAKRSKEIEIKTAPWIMGLENSLKKSGGIMKGLLQGKLLERKQELERQLLAWIDANSERKSKYGTVLADMRRLDNQNKSTRDRDADLGGIRWSSLLSAASTIVLMARRATKGRMPSANRGCKSATGNAWRRASAALPSAITATSTRPCWRPV